MKGESVFQHYRPQEKEFVERSIDIVRRVEEQYVYHLTEFLNPREVTILTQLCQQANLQCFASKDYYSGEYSRLIIAPEYYQLNIEDFEITILSVAYQTKFNTLTHPQVMGSLIHSLGIERSVFGDIITNDDKIQILVSKPMAEYMMQSVNKIGKVPVTLTSVSIDQLIEPKEENVERDILVSSLRLDKIVSVVLKLSRSKALKLIEQERVKVNYTPTKKSSDLLEVGDLVSVRGYGRFTIISENGQSKNGKFKLTIKMLMRK